MSLGCSVTRNSRLKIVKGEFPTSFDYFDEFHVNLLFDRSIYRPMCTHVGYLQSNTRFSHIEKDKRKSTTGDAHRIRK